MSLLSSKLRAARKAAGLTQGQVAARVGVTRGAVTHWESADPATRTYPGVDSLMQLANIYGVSVEWLLNNQPPARRPSPAATEPNARLSQAFWQAVDYELLLTGHARAPAEGADFLTDNSLAVFAACTENLVLGLGRILLAERLLGSSRLKHLLFYSPIDCDPDDYNLAARAGVHLTVVSTPREAANYLTKLP